MLLIGKVENDLTFNIRSRAEVHGFDQDCGSRNGIPGFPIYKIQDYLTTSCSLVTFSYHIGSLPECNKGSKHRCDNEYRPDG